MVVEDGMHIGIEMAARKGAEMIGTGTRDEIMISITRNFTGVHKL